MERGPGEQNLKRFISSTYKEEQWNWLVLMTWSSPALESPVW